MSPGNTNTTKTLTAYLAKINSTQTRNDLGPAGAAK